jgi:hypothetical protein
MRYAALLPVALLAPFLWGCADNNSSVFIRQLQAPASEPDDTGTCTWEADPSGNIVAVATMDRFFTLQYSGFLLVGNQLARRGDRQSLRVETSRVVFFEAEIEVFDFSQASLGAYTVPVTGFADPGDGSEPGYGLVAVPLIDPSIAQAVDTSAGGQTVVSRVKLYGETLGGLEVETGFWDLPINVCGDSSAPGGCLGCVVPASCDDEFVVSCRSGQDAPVDCRYDPNSTACQ